MSILSEESSLCQCVLMPIVSHRDDSVSVERWVMGGARDYINFIRGVVIMSIRSDADRESSG